MTFPDQLVLAPDTLVIPVAELPSAVRDEIGGDGDFALTRPRARAGSSLVDAAMAELLEEFRSPTTIADAIIRYSLRLATDPQQTLTAAYPALRRCLGQGFLVPAGSRPATVQEVRFAVGTKVAGGTVVRCRQVLEDTELYQLALDCGGLAALKVARLDHRGDGAAPIRREGRVLDLLAGHPAPRLLDMRLHGDSPWLLMEWCEGVPVTAAAAGLRRTTGTEGDLLALCQRVAGAYAELHERAVIHGDVHPGNVLVTPTGAVRLLDFGLARLLAADTHLEYPAPPRGGVPAYTDPELAAAQLAGAPLPAATPRSEQYSLAALLYEMFTGAPYVDFPLDPTGLLRAVVDRDPLPFTRRGRPPWPEVERVLAQALAKQPAHRLPSTQALAHDLSQVRTSASGHSQATGRTAADAVLQSVLDNARPGGAWFRDGCPDPPYCSVAYGAAGVAVALCRIAVVRSDPELLVVADEWAVRAARDAGRRRAFTSAKLGISDQLTGRVSPFHQLSGVHAAQSLVSHAAGDVLARQQAIAGFIVESQQDCDHLDLALGRAGTLLVAAILRESTGEDSGDALAALGNRVLADLWSQVDRLPPVAEATALPSLGVAHGWAGLLLATLRWCRATGAPVPPTLAERLDQLAALARTDGLAARWPWQSPAAAAAESFMPGWCNGSAGYVHLWTTAHTLLGEQRWASLAEQAGWDAYTTPSGVGQLCCGLAGQAYALLALYRHTGQRRWLAAATDLATQAAARLGGSSPQLPGSLHKGDVGVAALAADLADPEAAAMPLFGISE